MVARLFLEELDSALPLDIGVRLETSECLLQDQCAVAASDACEKSMFDTEVQTAPSTARH